MTKRIFFSKINRAYLLQPESFNHMKKNPIKEFLEEVLEIANREKDEQKEKTAKGNSNDFYDTVLFQLPNSCILCGNEMDYNDLQIPSLPMILVDEELKGDEAIKLNNFTYIKVCQYCFQEVIGRFSPQQIPYINALTENTS